MKEELDVVFDGTVSSYKLENDEIVIGRNTDDNTVDISIQSLIVSRRQLKITKRGSNLTVTDLGSANGTYLNNVKLVPNVEYPVWDGARLSVGKKKLVRLYVRSTLSWLPYFRQMANAQWNKQ